VKRSLVALFCGLLAPAAFAILDTNSNGLSDLWERDVNDGSLFDVSFDPLADSDSDGWTNAQEAAAGTDPLDPNPPDGLILPITTHAPEVWSEPDEFNEIHLVSPEAVIVTWPTLTGKKYTLLFSPDLTQGSWLPVDDPFIAYGGVSEYGFSDITDPDKRFWRVAVEDTDADSDGLNNYEEFLVGTNPTITDTDVDTLSDHAELVAGTDPLQADADGDGWNDPQEIAAGTDSRNQDSDGDGIPDSIDTQPLSNSLAFPDTDADGIPNQNDLAPNDPRGPAPSIASENASGNPLSNLIQQETVRFLLTVSNRSGPAPTATDLTFFLNGEAETNSIAITPIGTPVTSTQRFLLTWTAKTTPTYPSVTLQNLTLRFRDAQQATSWIKLARIDVAEWEGMIAGIPDGLTQESWVANVASHLNGKLLDPFELAGSTIVSVNRYRGPRVVSLLDADGRTKKGTATISSGVRYPLMIIARNSSSQTYAASRIVDISSPSVVPSRCLGYLNKSDHEVTMTAPIGGIKTTSGELKFHTLPDREDDLNENFYGCTGVITGQTDVFFDRRLEAPSASQSSRNLHFFSIENRGLLPNGLPTAQASLVSIIIGFEKSIRAHSAGSLEHPGLPLPPKNLETPELLPMSSGQWHKITLKAGPDTDAESNGIGLWLRKGENGDADPQASGFALKAQGDNGALIDLTVPPSGKIPLAANSPNWQRLRSASGLTVFLKRDETVTDIHDLSLQLLRKHDWQPQVAEKIASIDLFPVDVQDNDLYTGVDDVSNTAAATDTGYQSKYWIMAPAGTVPNSSPATDCENYTHFRIPLDPAGVLKIESVNVKPNPTTIAWSEEAPLPRVTWHGTTDETVDDTTIWKLGRGEVTADLPIGVKVIKKRTVKVAVWPVNRPGRDSLFPGAADRASFQGVIKAKLNQVFASQINAWFDVSLKAEQFFEHADVVNGTLYTITHGLKENAMIDAHRASDVDINIYVIGGGSSYYSAHPSAVGSHELSGSSYPTTESSSGTYGNCVVAKLKPFVEQTIAHEIGHLMLGRGHPDAGTGPAPLEHLTLADHQKRLMYSVEGYSGSLLVKSEWDEAEKWLRAVPDKRIFDSTGNTGNY
jgi:hypothetical protein